MKTIVIASLFVASMSFAQEPTTHGAAAGSTMGTETSAPAASKMSKKEAKAACKAEGKKGKEMKSCVKSKTM